LPGRAHGFHLGQPVTWLENADRPYTRASDPPEVPVSQLFPRSGLNPAWSDEDRKVIGFGDDLPAFLARPPRIVARP